MSGLHDCLRGACLELLKFGTDLRFFLFRQYCFHFSKSLVSGSERSRLTNSTVCACSWMIWPVCLPSWRSIVYLINQSCCNKPWDWNAKHVQQKKNVNQIQILQAQVPIQVIDQAAAETVAKSRKLPPNQKNNFFKKGRKTEPKGGCLYIVVYTYIYIHHTSIPIYIYTHTLQVPTTQICSLRHLNPDNWRTFTPCLWNLPHGNIRKYSIKILVDIVPFGTLTVCELEAMALFCWERWCFTFQNW